MPQVEVGSAATDFEHRELTTEFQSCQRYFWKLDVTDGGDLIYFSENSNAGGGNWKERKPFPVEMRTTPAVTSSINVAVGFTAGAIEVTKRLWGYGAALGAATENRIQFDNIEFDAEL